MTVTTNEHGQQNIFAKEPQVRVMDIYETQNEIAEKWNGRWAMLGIIAGIASYISTGNLFFGVW